MEPKYISDVESLVKAGMTMGDVRQVKEGIPFVVMPRESLVNPLEELLDAPVRNRTRVDMDNASSFARYFNEHKTPASRIFVQLGESRAVIVGCIDYNEKGKTSWRGHNVVYSCPPTPEWLAWIGSNKRGMDQESFAEFIEDNLTDIVDPDSAEMLEIAKTLEAKINVDFKAGIRLDNGNQQLRFEETTEAKAGQKGDLTVPTIITLGIAPFKGIMPWEIKARLKYRIEDGSLTFTYELIKPHKVLELAAQNIIETLHAECKIEPFMGQVLKCI